MKKKIISTENAPSAIGPYSQAVQVGDFIFLSGQIPLDPQSGQLVNGITAQIEQAFKNVLAIAEASGGSNQNFVKINIYLTDLNHFAKVNEIMEQFFDKPYPARAAIQVSKLPKGADIEIDGIMFLNH